MNADGQFTVSFSTPEGAAHLIRIALSGPCAALADERAVEQVVVEALLRWEKAAGVEVFALARQGAQAGDIALEAARRRTAVPDAPRSLLQGLRRWLAGRPA